MGLNADNEPAKFERYVSPPSERVLIVGFGNRYHPWVMHPTGELGCLRCGPFEQSAVELMFADVEHWNECPGVGRT